MFSLGFLPECDSTMTAAKIVLCATLVQIVNGAKILGVFPIASISHQVVYQPIWKELSLRGHEVTVITPNPLKDPTLTNLTEIDVSSLYDTFSKVTATFTNEVTPRGILDLFVYFQTSALDEIMNNEEVIDLLSDNTKQFDLVMVEFLSALPSVFAYKYKCPLVGVASVTVLASTHEAVGNPAHPIAYPNLLLNYGKEMNFYQKIYAVLFGLYERLRYYYYDLPTYDKFARMYFGQEMPYLGDLERNVSMLLINANPVFHMARPTVPGVVHLEMMHIKPKKPLPQDIKDFLDDAKEGVIYFSLGSNVKSIHIDLNKRKIIMDVFSKLPYKILWKFESDNMPNKPINVKISKWLPQQDLLGHPNLKLFITQGGLQSTEEAIYNQVPLLAMPFIGDQFFNARRISELGIGRNLDFNTLEEDAFKSAISEIIQNKKYKEKIKEISEIIRDQPMTGLEKAVWWTEYVLRHKGTPYFRPAVVDMAWYQYFLLDVLAVFVIILSLAFIILYKIGICVLQHTNALKYVITKKEKIKET